jgi:CubicO group peptidase (beta-lactamase class C family)
MTASIVAAALTVGVAPGAGALAPYTGVGDAGLAAAAGPILERTPLDQAGVAYIDASGTRYAYFGADADTEFEIGSITKTFTAELFADAVARGEVRENTRLGELLPVAGTPVADVSLAEVAGHVSGLPQFPLTPNMALGGIRWQTDGKNPFTFDRAELLDQARWSPLLTRGVFGYSTLGYALLGEAVAAAAHTDYSTLLRERMLDPLGLARTWLPLTAADLPPDASTGFNAQGRPQDPWPIDAYSPAGGLRSTVPDMARYASALLNGTVPGMDALTPRWAKPAGTRGAMSWTVVSRDGHDYTMHSGGTGGFQGVIVLDRDRHRAVVIQTNRIAGLEKGALDLLNAV